MKKTINLVSTKISKMKLTGLYAINRESENSRTWINSQKHILTILTIGGIIVVLIWHLLDKFYVDVFDSRLLFLRWITIAVFGINILLGLIRKNQKATKQHIVAGFYFGTTFCMLLAMFTGASQSPYWFGLFFIIVAWFVLVPYNFREMMLHSFVFVLMFVIGQYGQKEFAIVDHEMGKIVFFYSVTLSVSIFAAYIRNQLDAANFKIKKELELKNRELEATNNELKKFRLVLDQAPGAVFIMDKYSSFEYINPWFTKISGYTENDLLQKNINDTLYRGISEVPESRKDVIKCLSEGKIWQGELLTTNKNGTNYWANTIAAPFKNEKDEIDGYVVIQQDITERKQLELALAEQEKLYRSLIEKSLDGIVISQDGKVLLVNKAFADMIGYTIEECIATFGPHSIVPEDRERVMNIHLRRMKGELGDMRYNAGLVGKNGNIVIAEFNTTTIEINGKAGSLVSIRDVTERMKLQENMEKSERKYKTLVENSLEGITIIRDNRFVFANDTYCKMLGYNREELYKMPSVETLHPDDWKKAFGIAERRQKKDFSTINEVFRMMTKSGEIRECETSSTVIEFDGEWASFFTSHDITENKKTERALLESEKKYRELAEMLPQSVYELDKNGSITYMNQTGLRKFGISVADYGRSAFDFIAQEQHKLMETNMTKSINENYHTQGTHYTAVKNDGTKFPVMIFASPMFENGEITGTRGIILDMSSHIAMENALKESEEKYRTLIEKAVDGIIITQYGKLKFVNQSFCELVQYSEEDLLEKPYTDFVVPEYHQMMNNYHKRRMAGEEFQTMYRSRIYKKDGSLLEVELNTRTSLYNNQPAAFIIVRDITERLKTEEQLRIAKEKLEILNQNLEIRIRESSLKLTEVNTQLIRLQKENLQSQFEVLRQQVNPHFLFNSLNVLTSLIKLEPDLAEKFTEHLSKVYRYVLENKDNDLVNLQTELDFLDAYIFLLNIRFLDKIEVNVEIGDDKKALLILPLALQLLIENAIKHNAMSKKNPLKIRISVGGDNTLIVANNLQERESHMASTGVGLKNIEHRYYLLELPAPQFYKTETEFIAQIPLKS